MAEIPSFRSALNGFNRTDVLDYVQKLLDEKAALTTELEDARKELAENAAQIAAFELKVNDIDEHHKDEQMLGRALYDARRFSDELVQDATGRANMLMVNAADAADGLSVQIGDLVREIGNTSDFIDDAIEQIKSKLFVMDEMMQEFSRMAISEKILKDWRVPASAEESADYSDSEYEDFDEDDPAADDLPATDEDSVYFDEPENGDIAESREEEKDVAVQAVASDEEHPSETRKEAAASDGNKSASHPRITVRKVKR